MRRKTDRHLPPCIYPKHGAFWLVKKNKWERLGTDLSAALTEYGRRVAGQPGNSMSDLIDNAIAAMKVSPSTLKQYKATGNRLKTIFIEFAPDQVRGKHVAAMKESSANTRFTRTAAISPCA